MTESLLHRPFGSPRSGSIIGDWWHTVDRWVLGAVLLLFTMGIVLGLAASPPLAEKNGLWTYHYVTRHAVFVCVALAIMVTISMLRIEWVRRGGLLLFLGALAATALLPVLGTDFGKGAVRWYSLGFFSLQPSEFLKPGFIMVTAWLMAGSLDRNGPPGQTISGALALGIGAMLALQPDFGQAMLVMSVWATMLFVAGAPILLLVGFGAVIAAGGTTAYFGSEHFRRRIDLYLSEEIDPNTQLAYAESAIREGGLYGVGAAAGQVKWTLPDAHTDFIIAVAAEEFGLLLTLFIVALYLFITIRTLFRMIEVSDPFLRFAGTGLSVLLGLQAFVNVSVAIRLLPAKGMTLPFISYGGSSMLAGALLIGALLAIGRDRPQDPGRALRERL